MKKISEKQGLDRLFRLKKEVVADVGERFEERAKSCAVCETPGACCLDAHFVNVHITRLEAAAIRRVIDRLPTGHKERVYERVEDAISKYGLSNEGDTLTKTYACPLFEKGAGCLVHNQAKPLPCIFHACYENKEDLPPDELLTEQEGRVERLNRLTYSGPAKWEPLPVAVMSVAS